MIKIKYRLGIYSALIIPQAQRSPEFPVDAERGLLPLPRSSSPE